MNAHEAISLATLGVSILQVIFVCVAGARLRRFLLEQKANAAAKLPTVARQSPLVTFSNLDTDLEELDQDVIDVLSPTPLSARTVALRTQVVMETIEDPEAPLGVRVHRARANLGL